MPPNDTYIVRQRTYLYVVWRTRHNDMDNTITAQRSKPFYHDIEANFYFYTSTSPRAAVDINASRMTSA